MPSINRTFAHTALVLAAGALLSVAAVAQDKAATAPPSADLTAKVVWLEKMVKYLQGEVNLLKQQLKQQGGGSGGQGGAAITPKNLDAKITELTKKLENHTHEYQLEGRAADGSIQAVAQDRFPGSGLNSTGGARIGKAIVK